MSDLYSSKQLYRALQNVLAKNGHHTSRELGSGEDFSPLQRYLVKYYRLRNASAMQFLKALVLDKLHMQEKLRKELLNSYEISNNSRSRSALSFVNRLHDGVTITRTDDKGRVIIFNVRVPDEYNNRSYEDWRADEMNGWIHAVPGTCNNAPSVIIHKNLTVLRSAAIRIPNVLHDDDLQRILAGDDVLLFELRIQNIHPEQIITSILYSTFPAVWTEMQFMSMNDRYVLNLGELQV